MSGNYEDGKSDVQLKEMELVTKTNYKTENEEEREKQEYGFFSLYRFADRFDWILIFFGTIGGIAGGAAQPLFPLILGRLINSIGDFEDTAESKSKLMDNVEEAAINFVIVAIGAWFFNYINLAFYMWTGTRQTAHLRKEYLESVLNQDISYFDRDQTTGSLLQGLNEDALQVQMAIGDKMGNLIHHLSGVAVGLIVAFIHGWKLALIVVATMPLLALAGFAIAQIIGFEEGIMSKAYSKANAVALSAIQNIRTVASFNAEEKTLDKYNKCLEEPEKLGVRVSLLDGIAIGLINLIIFGAFALTTWVGSELVISDGYEGGDVFIVIFAAIIAGFELGQAAPNFQYFTKGSIAGDRILKKVNRIPEIKDDPQAKKLDNFSGAIQLQGVQFVYPVRPDVPVFQDFTLTIPAGKTVALVGSSGSGKSTVVQLLEGFYDPIAGSVFLDGVDIKDLSLTWYRDQLGLVSQEPTLFATTIRQNIMYGCEGATEEQMIDATKAANAFKFISQLPNKFDTQVGERGVQLSGGQKQRIAIARAILKNPKIMLLDEATSALDTQSERIVQEALDNMIIGRTTVVIAHRLSTIRNADMIAVVQQGAIVELGSHDELIKKDAGAYQTLVRLQQQHAEDEDTNYKGAAAVDVDEIVMSTADVSVQSAGQFGNSVVSYDTTRRSSLEADVKENEGDQKKKDGGGVPYTRLLEYQERSEWVFAFFGCLASAALGAGWPLFAVALSEMVGIYYYEDQSRMREDARMWALVFTAIAVGWFICSVIQQYCFGYMGHKLVRRLRIRAMRVILHQEMAWFDNDENSSGNITAKLATEAVYVRGAVGDQLGIIIQDVVSILTGVIIAFVTYWPLALVVMACFPVLAVSMVLLAQFQTGQSGQNDDLLNDANKIATESISSVRIVQAYNMQPRIVKLYENLMQGPIRQMTKQANITGFLFGFSWFAIFSTLALSFWFGGRQVKNGDTNLEEILKVFFSIIMGINGAASAQMQFPNLGKAGAAVKWIFSIIDAEPKINSMDMTGQQLQQVKGDVELKDVDFVYPARPTVKVFRKFNLQVPSGQTVALVGESGSGKSTVVSLIERFYEPVSGQVLIDGVNIQSLQLKWLRDQVGLVSQEPILFSMSIMDNIKYGRDDASLEEVKNAAKVANAEEFISRFPENYDTMIGDQGIQLSGGQKQRIAIARAVLKNPVIMLLDEATSALDAESEKVVQEALDRIMEGRTTIVVAHRLSTIRNADKIAVVNKGVVAELGTHDQLMAKPKGLFLQMVRAQTKRN